MQSEGYICFKADGESSSKAIYEAYKMWCEDNALHALAANRLSSELAQNEEKYNVEATNNIYLDPEVKGCVDLLESRCW